jgi:AcrR family transcriptional regulator
VNAQATHQTAAPPRRNAKERRRAVAGAALQVLAEQGARGLTHRAVDERAGPPQGSTSNVFRSRKSLLEGALKEHSASDLAVANSTGGNDPELPPISREQAADLIAAGVQGVLGRLPHSIARFELLLEANRDEVLHEEVAAARARFATGTVRLLTAAGCESPERHSKQLLATLDGIILAELHGEAAALDSDDIHELVSRLLETC